MWNLYTFEELTDTFVTEPKLQLNPVDADTEGTIESVRIKRLSVKRGLTVTPEWNDFDSFGKKIYRKIPKISPFMYKPLQI